MSRHLTIYFDLDHTLTFGKKHPRKGQPNPEMIEAVKKLIADGEQVTIWSAGGEQYVKNFCKKHGIEPLHMVGKPRYCVDDCPTIRPAVNMPIYSPQEFLKRQK